MSENVYLSEVWLLTMTLYLDTVIGALGNPSTLSLSH